MKNYFKKIVGLFIRNNYPESTRQQFYHWLMAGEHRKEKDETLKWVWKEAEKQKYSKPDLKQSYKRLQRESNIPSVSRNKTRTLRIWQVAATILFAVASTSLYFVITNQPDEDLIQHYIPVAQMQEIILPDGTQVQLNSRSTLLYPEAFSGKKRSVFLIGEANFKVKPNKKQPFIVKSDDFQVTALGTEFNVSAYPEDITTTATLISGSIRVDYDNLNTSVILKPNEQLAYNRSNKNHWLSSADLEDVTAWQRGELVFREATLQNIISVLERKYDYTFICHVQEDDRYSFRFRDQAPLNEVLDIICGVVGNIDYQINEKVCKISKKTN